MKFPERTSLRGASPDLALSAPYAETGLSIGGFDGKLKLLPPIQEDGGNERSLQ